MIGDLYRILGVRTDASAETIRKAYRKRAARHHPDRNPGDAAAPERFRQVRHAYDVLSDPERRKKYDDTGDDAAPRTTEDCLIASIVIPLMIEVMHTVARSSFSGGLKKNDIAKRMREVLESRINDAEENVRKIKVGIEELRVAAGRFSVKSGPNLLEEAVQSQIATGERARGEAEASRDVMKRAYDYLHGVKYRVDGDKEDTGHEARAMLNQFFGNLVIS